jgi:amidohydrolase
MSTASTALKQLVHAAADRRSATARELAMRIHANPEVSGQEQKAARWCAEALASADFRVDWVRGVEHGFVATREGAQPGPTVALLAEYDALPGLGHACGHNLIAGSAVGAALALAELMDRLPGRVQVFGCPAEETGQGKPALLAAGVFEGVDVALTFHAWHTTAVMTQCNGLQQFDFTFRGRAAHAATDPWAGASALDGVLLTYQNLNALRQFVRDGVRIHGVVTDGGQAANVIPARAACRVAVRAMDQAELERVVGRVLDCARAAALASGTELSVERVATMDPVRPNSPLAQLHAANLAALGEQTGEWRALASTDFGNVSQRLPALLFSLATWPESVAFHSTEAAEAAGQPRAYLAMQTAATGMAMTAVDILTQPGVLAPICSAHREVSP